MKKNQLLSIFLFLIGSTFLSAQSTTVTGKVTSAGDGEDVIGATIILKGDETIGTTTEIDGTYSMEISNAADAVLIFSYTGFKTLEVPVNGRTTIDVELEAGFGAGGSRCGRIRDSKEKGSYSSHFKSEI